VYHSRPIRSLTQEDPIGLAGGLNVYGFAGGDPVTFSDPFGLICTKRNYSKCKIISFHTGLNWGAGLHGTIGPVELRGQVGKVGVQGTLTQTAGGEVERRASGTAALFSGTARFGSRQFEASVLKCETGEGCKAGSVGRHNVEVESNGDVGASAQLIVV